LVDKSYIMNILKVLSTYFLWWIFSIWWYYFLKNNLCFGFDIFNLLTFLCPWNNKFIVTSLFYDKTNKMITMWDAMEYAIHTHYIQFFETSIGISSNLHELEINSYFNFENCYFETETFIFNFVSFSLNMKVHISILEIIISI